MPEPPLPPVPEPPLPPVPEPPLPPVPEPPLPPDPVAVRAPPDPVLEVVLVKLGPPPSKKSPERPPQATESQSPAAATMAFLSHTRLSHTRSAIVGILSETAGHDHLR